MGKRAKNAQNGYKTGTWANLPHYQCLSCAFDTLDLDEMLAHLVQMHSPASPLSEPLRDLESGMVILTEPDEVAQGIFEIDVKE